MQILSHRGLWKSKNEQNTKQSFEISLEKNFGIETDVRDYNGELVISHDMPEGRLINMNEFLDIYKYITDKKNISLPSHKHKSRRNLPFLEKNVKGKILKIILRLICQFQIVFNT